ncbi:MAG: DUF29 domain-containing protein [Candidatus Tectimicrobiota bacterium]
MSARDRRALASHYENLLLHLLKWRYQPTRRQTGHSWADSIREARRQLVTPLPMTAADQAAWQRSLARRYRVAHIAASRQTGLALATFPATCPWTIAQVLAADFWPEAYPPSARATSAPTCSVACCTGSGARCA